MEQQLSNLKQALNKAFLSFFLNLGKKIEENIEKT